MMVDKYAVKPYVAALIGEEHVIPTLGVWDVPEDIDSSGPGIAKLDSADLDSVNRVAVDSDRMGSDRPGGRALAMLDVSLDEQIDCHGPGNLV